MTTKQSVTFRLARNLLNQLETQSRDSQKSKTQILEESLMFWLKKMNKKKPKINKFDECIGVLTEMEADSWLKKTSERKNKSLINFD